MKLRIPSAAFRGAAQLFERQLVSADQKNFTDGNIEQSDRLKLTSLTVC